MRAKLQVATGDESLAVLRCVVGFDERSRVGLLGGVN